MVYIYDGGTLSVTEQQKKDWNRGTMRFGLVPDVCMMHLSMILVPDVCMMRLSMILVPDVCMMHKCMMHISMILAPDVCMMHECMMHLSMILVLCMYDVHMHDLGP